MFFSHDTYNEPIGCWENIRIEGGKLMADANFDPEDEKAKRIAGKVERGYLKGVSIGLRVLKVEEAMNSTTVTEWELMEASIVSLPANAGAVKLYDRNGIALESGEIAKLFIDNQKNKKMDETETIELSAKVVELSAELTAKDIRIAELEKQLSDARSAEIDAFLTAAVTSRKISAKEKETMAKLAASDFDGVKELLSAKPEKPLISLHDMMHRETSGATGSRAEWSYLQWMKEDPQGLKKLKAENPGEFERLKSAMKG